jgi:hypothetical protein
LKPDYAPAREYLGELYVQMGDVAKAKEQLAMLTKLEAPEAVTNLKGKIDAWSAAHPESAAPPVDATKPPAADSSASATHGSDGR